MELTSDLLGIPEGIDKNLLRDLLCSTWMRHDAMWLYHCSNEIGMELTNKINRAAARDVGLYEGKRLMAALGYKGRTPQDFDEYQELLTQMFGIITASFIKGTLTFVKEESKVRLTWLTCFAHQGTSRMGIIDQYECGPFDRIAGWFDALGARWEVNPKITGCMMQKDGQCYQEYSLFFDNP